jgi:branched-chain amino acid transport system ATP-binding protein
MIILEIEGITKDFGGLRALNEVNLIVHRGEILGLIGPNGSGKTTLFNIITGILKPDSGHIRYKGELITGLQPNQIAFKGIGRTFQLSSLFTDISVKENVKYGRYLRTSTSIWQSLINSRGFREEQKKLEGDSMEILSFVGMGKEADVLAKNLPYGSQRKLELATALALNAELLLLDEPATGMNPEEVTENIDLIKLVREKGTTVVVVEHHMEVIMNICDRVAVLNEGFKIAEGHPKEVAENEEVISVYLGRRRKIA